MVYDGIHGVMFFTLSPTKTPHPFLQLIMCPLQRTLAHAAHSNEPANFTLRFRCNRLNINGGVTRREIPKTVVMAILVLSLIKVQRVTQRIVLTLCHTLRSMVVEFPNEILPSWTGNDL